MNPQACGSGPGAQARDGCSVELYRRLAYLGDLDAVRGLLGPGTSVLELGCGAGRLTRKLIEWGLSVTAVDNCAEMLDSTPTGAARVLSDIESLQLDMAFDTVLMASCLINHAALSNRVALAAAACRHVAPGGQVLVERHDADWLATARVGPAGKADDIEIFVEAVDRVGPVIEMTLRYQLLAAAWRHSFAVVALLEQDVEQLLSESRFGRFEWFGPKRRWVRATAAG